MNFLSQLISLLKSLLAIVVGFLVLGLTIFPSGINLGKYIKDSEQ